MIRRALVVVGAALLFALPAGAEERLELWVLAAEGPRVLPPSPLEVAVVRRGQSSLLPVGSLELSASAGELRQTESDDPFVARALFLPPPDLKGEVHLEARAAGALAGRERLSFGESAQPRVIVELDPPLLLKGEGEAVRVSVRVLAPDGGLLPGPPPRLFTNTGRLGAVVEEGPGRFSSTYLPSDAAYPEVAAILALLPGSAAVGRAILPQPAAIDLPGETRAGVEMEVEIAGRRFGPVRADARGRFVVPVVVPPGTGRAQGISRDRLGNVRRTSIDLRLPPTDRLALATSASVLVADGAATSLVVVSRLEPDGADALPVVRASRGHLSPLVEVAPGLFCAWYTAPDKKQDGRVKLQASLPGERGSRVVADVRLVARPPLSLELALDRFVTAPGAAVEGTVTLGEGEAAASVIRGSAEHGRVVLGEAGRLSYLPPGSARPGRDRVTVRAFARAEGPAVAVAFAPPGAILVVDALSRPVPGAAVLADGQHLFADHEGRLPLEATPGVHQLRVKDAPAPSRLRVEKGPGGELHGAPRVRAPVQQTVELSLAPPLPVLVDAGGKRQGEGLQVRWQVRGGAEGDGVRIYVDGALAREGEGASGAALISAPSGAHVTVTHVPTGVGASFQAADAT